MSIYASPLPADCKKELEELLQGLSDKELQDIASIDPMFSKGGFRKVAAIRSRLREIVMGGPEIKDSLRRFFSYKLLCGRIFALLTPEQIRDICEPLEILQGHAVVMLALMLDVREEVRKVAQERLDEKTEFFPLPVKKMNTSTAYIQLRGRFAPVTELLSSLEDEADEKDIEEAEPEAAPVAVDTAAVAAPEEGARPAEATSKEVDERLKDLQAQLKEQSRENRRLKTVEEKFQQSRQHAETLQKNLTATQQQLKNVEKELRHSDDEVRMVRQELKQERHDRQRFVEAELKLAWERELHGWIAGARAVEQAVAEVDTPAGDALLARADEALRRQMTVDRHSGNRRELTERLTRLRDKLAEVRDALRHALRQEPELRKVERELATETRRLAAMLQIDEATTPAEENLLALIHTESEARLTELRDLLERLVTLRVFGENSVARLRGELRKRMDALYACRELPPPPVISRKPSELPAPAVVRYLHSLLAKGAPGLLLIDGHNVIGGPDGDYHPELNHAEKREALARELAHAVAEDSTLLIKIFFDGPLPREVDVSPHVRVVYSGGEGQHRADRAIVQHIDFLRHQDAGQIIILASDDNELRAEAAAPGRNAHLLWRNELPDFLAEL